MRTQTRIYAQATALAVAFAIVITAIILEKELAFVAGVVAAIHSGVMLACAIQDRDFERMDAMRRHPAGRDLR